MLQRVWSQNIDTLETAAGVPHELVVEAHGSFRTAHCLKCRRSASTEYVLKAGVRQGTVVRCEKCDGLVKPDIVFFGEGLPEHFFELMVSARSTRRSQVLARAREPLAKDPRGGETYMRCKTTSDASPNSVVPTS